MVLKVKDKKRTDNFAFGSGNLLRFPGFRQFHDPNFLRGIFSHARPHAVRLDGASDWRIFHQVVLPMSRNSIAALAIFTFLWNWEDYLWPFLMITDDDKQLLSVGLKMFSGQYGTDYGGLFAATSVTIIPVVIVYLVFQKQFIAGIATGSGK